MSRWLDIPRRVETLIGTGTAAGSRVYVHRVRPLTDDHRPLPDPDQVASWINIRLGPIDTPGGDGQTVIGRLDWFQTLYIDVHVRGKGADWLAGMMGLIDEIHALLMADHTLGTAGVIKIDALGMEEPETDSKGDQIAAAVRTNWRVRHRTAVTDLGTAA